jgi:transcription termination/antitermination protein NusA
VGDRVKVYVTDVVLTPKGTRVFISRTAPDMLKRMFEKEIPEVFDGTVEIKSIARDAGDRAKVIVQSHDENVDAIGTMVGLKVHVSKESFANLRVKKWISLNGQKIKRHLLPML